MQRISESNHDEYFLMVQSNCRGLVTPPGIAAGSSGQSLIMNLLTFALLWQFCWELSGLVLAGAVATGDHDDIAGGRMCADEGASTCQAGSVDEEHASSSNSSKQATTECGVWLALSTLPGAGIGIFAGKNFSTREQFMPAGDHTVPIVDIIAHNGGRNFFFLWDEYTWVCLVKTHLERPVRPVLF